MFVLFHGDNRPRRGHGPRPVAISSERSSVLPRRDRPNLCADSCLGIRLYPARHAAIQRSIPGVRLVGL